MSTQPDSEDKVESQAPVQCDDERFGRLNFVLFGVGICLMILGYVALALAGSGAVGAFGRLAPVGIVSGMVVFGVGFLPGSKSEK